MVAGGYEASRIRIHGVACGRSSRRKPIAKDYDDDRSTRIYLYILFIRIVQCGCLYMSVQVYVMCG